MYGTNKKLFGRISKSNEGEGDVFRIIVPLDESYSFDFSQTERKNGISDTNCDTIDTNQNNGSNLQEKLMKYIELDSTLTQKEYAAKLNVSVPTVKRLFAKLQKEEVLIREGTNRKGQWKVMRKNKEA